MTAMQAAWGVRSLSRPGCGRSRMDDSPAYPMLPGMGRREGERNSAERPRCPVCNDIVGVYEPLIHLFDGFAIRSSRAAEPEICSTGHCFHLACYERFAGEA